MHLVYWCLGNNQTPTVLPKSLVDQAMNAVVFSPTNYGYGQSGGYLAYIFT